VKSEQNDGLLQVSIGASVSILNQVRIRKFSISDLDRIMEIENNSFGMEDEILHQIILLAES